MGQRPAPTGKRAEILRRAYLLHHARRITTAQLTRVIRQFRPKR